MEIPFSHRHPSPSFVSDVAPPRRTALQAGNKSRRVTCCNIYAERKKEKHRVIQFPNAGSCVMLINSVPPNASSPWGQQSLFAPMVSGGGIPAGGIYLSFHDAVAEEPCSLYPKFGPASTEGHQSRQTGPAGLGQAAWCSTEPTHSEG